MHVQDPCGIPFIIMRKKALHFLELDSFFVGEVFPFAMNVNVWSSRKDVMRAFWLLTLPSIVHCTHPIGTLPISILPELDINIQIRKREHFPLFGVVCGFGELAPKKSF